jgi:carbamoyltransferase
MYVLGIHFGHNATATLFKDGEVLGCVSEERFSGIKNQLGFPFKSIKYLLKEYKLDPKDIDYVAVPYRYSPPVFGAQQAKRNLWGMILIFLYSIVKFIGGIWFWLEYRLPFLRPFGICLYNMCAEVVGGQVIRQEVKFISHYLGIDKNRILTFDHHFCHGAAAYYGSPYNKEDALIFTIDAEGDKTCASVSTIKDGKYERLATTPLGHSLGWIYIFVTMYLGMKPGEHEYKVMGLAPYAKKYEADKVYEIVKDLLILDEKNPLIFKTKLNTRGVYKFMKKNFEKKKFVDVAAAVQRLVEERVVEWVKEGIKKTGIKTVVCGGGVFMNVKANLRIAEIDEVEKLFIMPSSGDESLPIGAAYHTYVLKSHSSWDARLGARLGTLASGLVSGRSPRGSSRDEVTDEATGSHGRSHGKSRTKPREVTEDRKVKPIDNLYWGPKFSNEEIEEFIKKNGYNERFKVEKIDNIEQKIAELLNNDKVVARVAGRMEWGARALGNRSILANPRNPDTVRIINEQIKMRDFWMPFTPSILKERESDYIVNPKKIPAKFMTITFYSTPLARKELRAAMHAYDFTIRPQLVDKEYNPGYYKLIKEFEKLTGIGGILNTSFNIHGKPIVLGPKEAFEAFENSGLEYLVLENYLVSKKTDLP